MNEAYQPVVDKISLGILKDMLERNITTIDKLSKSGIDEKYIHILQNNF